MQIIKKYANRKLYHTNRKQYIRLEGIALLIQSGKQVQVVDNETGEDITAHILSQVVSQVRGRSGGTLPATVLTNLIRFGGDTIANLRQVLLTSLNIPGTIEVEIGQRISRLVDEGLLTRDEATRLRRLLLRADMMQASYHDLIASRKTVLHLQKQVEDLTSTVEHLIRQQSTAHTTHTDRIETYENQFQIEKPPPPETSS